MYPVPTATSPGTPVRFLERRARAVSLRCWRPGPRRKNDEPAAAGPGPANQTSRPTRDQPPSWPAGEPAARPGRPPGSNQGQPPSWPSGDQPPSWPVRPGQRQPPSRPRRPAARRGRSDRARHPRGPPPVPAWPPARPAAAIPARVTRYGYGPRPPRFRRRCRRSAPLDRARPPRRLRCRGPRPHQPPQARSRSRRSPAASGGLHTGLQAPPGAVGATFNLEDGTGDTLPGDAGEGHRPGPWCGPGQLAGHRQAVRRPRLQDQGTDRRVRRTRTPTMTPCSSAATGRTYSADFDRHRRLHQLRQRLDPRGAGRHGDGSGDVPGPGRGHGLEGPVERAQRVRFDGRVERACAKCLASAERRAAAVLVTVGGDTGERRPPRGS